MSAGAHRQAGFALVLTLVITALMVAVLVEMIHQVYVDTSLSRGFRNGQQASILAESGATGAVKLMQLALSGRDYTSLSDQWATPIKLEDEAGSLAITISEESGKININALVLPNGEYEPFTHAALRRLGSAAQRKLKLAPDVWGAVADWLDGDDLPRSGGVESSYYRTLKPAYSARNGRLVSLTELSLVRGFTPQIVDSLRPFVTVFSDGSPLPKVNINTAPKEVLIALDDRIDERMAERIIEERSLQPFKATGELSRVPGMGTVSTSLIGKIGVKGTLFRLTAVARVKESARTVEAVVRFAGSSPDVVSWQEF